MNDKTVRVRDVMRPKFIMVDGMLTVIDAIKRLSADNADELIVDKRHDDDAYGLVLLSDIAIRVLAANRAPERVSLYEIMSKPVITVDAALKARYCARLFENVGITTAPVIDDGKLVGIVGYRELALDAVAYRSGGRRRDGD